MAASRIELEYNEINERDGWHSLFQEIREKCEKEAKEKAFSVSESGRNENRSLNRYRDVNPYDHSRIILHRGNTDYINANLVKMERADRKYILTQGPLRETIGHFWLMIWEQNTKAILMLNKLREKKQIKCHMYWPEKMGEEHILNLTDVGLTVEYLECYNAHFQYSTSFCKRIFRLTDVESKKSREVIQFHYTTWPDFGVPSSPVEFLKFLKQVRDSGALDPDVGPAVIHCSAGIGRSGTFCLVDCCLVLIDKEGEDKVSVQDVLYELRRYRMGLIQTPDQLYFSYQAIIEGIKFLKNRNWMDYDEVPFIAKDESLDETPPPLPPRTHSLQATLTINKPLPTIPNSESLHEDFVTSLNDTNAVKNFINSEQNIDYAKSNLNRPLPPIPKGHSLEKVAESGSDEDEVCDDSIDDENSALTGGETDEISELTSLSAKKDNTNNYIEQNLKPTQNGVDLLNTSSNEGSENVELKRRKRVERQANIEKKVNEIKRKQREVEEESRKSSKKRRSLIKFIAAGVIVGVLCVYAYSKFG